MKKTVQSLFLCGTKLDVVLSLCRCRCRILCSLVSDPVIQAVNTVFLLWEAERYECNQVLKGKVLLQCSQILRMFAVLADTVCLLSFYFFCFFRKAVLWKLQDVQEMNKVRK